MKKKLFYTFFGLGCLTLVLYSLTPDLTEKIYNKINYDTIANCKFIQKDDNKYCQTKHIKYYDTNVYFKNPVTFLSNKNKNAIYFNELNNDDLEYIREKIRKKALFNSLKLKDFNKIILAACIIEKQNHTTSKNNSEEENKYIAEDIVQITQIDDYIKNSDRVIRLSDSDIKKLPVDIIKKDFNKIKYAAYYNGNIINYYTDNGEILLKEYLVNNEPLRYQVYDNNNEFYTFDKNKKLIEYSKDKIIYDSNNKMLYKTSDAEISSPQISKKKSKYVDVNYKGKKKKSPLRRANKFHIPLKNKLENPDTTLYKSFTAILDKQYSKGSYELMLKELNSYFTNLKTKNPEDYQCFHDAAKKKSFTLNFIKLNGKYVFSINNTYVPDLEKTISSMADTVNTYEGRCAEPVLKTILKDNYSDNYFYDIKVSVKNGKLIAKEHPPCTACNKNISIWGWKYPKTSIK